jgi:hypothetical protein
MLLHVSSNLRSLSILWILWSKHDFRKIPRSGMTHGDSGIKLHCRASDCRETHPSPIPMSSPVPIMLMGRPSRPAISLIMIKTRMLHMNPRSDVLPSPIESTSLIWCFTVVLLNSPFLIQPKLLGIRFRQFLQPYSYPTTRIWFIDFTNFIHFSSLKRTSKFSGWNSSPIRSQLMSAINLHLGGIFQLWHCMEFQQQLHKALVSRHCGRGQGRGAWSGSQKWRGDGFEGWFMAISWIWRMISWI